MKTWQEKVADGDVYENVGEWFENLNDDQLRERARLHYEDEGAIEIDDNADISAGADHGAYVQAWVWVYYPTVEPENND